MFYKAKVAVYSEIRTKHINAMWAPRRSFHFYLLKSVSRTLQGNQVLITTNNFK
jgi:hypothetical protein